jgi:hypothetical protein
MPGRVQGGDTGDVVADRYHRVEADLDLMNSLNLDVYRSPSRGRASSRPVVDRRTSLASTSDCGSSMG